MTAIKSHARTGVSLAKGPVTLLGIAAVAWGIACLIAGGNDFTTGDLRIRDSFFGFESNGWTNVGWIGGGALLLLAASAHWAAKATALLVALAAATACIAGLIDGNDVFDIAAVDGGTCALFGAAAVVLAVTALLPRVGGRRDVDAVEQPAAPAPVTVERPAVREPAPKTEPEAEPERDPERVGAGGVTRTTDVTH